MTGFLLSVLFAASAVFAIGVIAASWRRHGPDVLALRQQVRAIDDAQECRYTITTIEIRPAVAAVYRPDFMRSAGRRPVQPLRAAA